MLLFCGCKGTAFFRDMQGMAQKKRHGDAFFDCQEPCLFLHFAAVHGVEAVVGTDINDIIPHD